MRIAFLTTLLTLLLNASGIQFMKNYDDALAEAKKTHKPLMLFLTQPGCGVCRFMEDEVFTDQKVRAYAAAHFVSAEFYIQDPDLPETYRAEVSPVITFIDPDSGDILEQILGGKKPSYFYDALVDIIDEHPKFNGLSEQ